MKKNSTTSNNISLSKVQNLNFQTHSAKDQIASTKPTTKSKMSQNDDQKYYKHHQEINQINEQMEKVNQICLFKELQQQQRKGHNPLLNQSTTANSITPQQLFQNRQSPKDQLYLSNKKQKGKVYEEDQQEEKYQSMSTKNASTNNQCQNLNKSYTGGFIENQNNGLPYPISSFRQLQKLKGKGSSSKKRKQSQKSNKKKSNGRNSSSSKSKKSRKNKDEAYTTALLNTKLEKINDQHRQVYIKEESTQMANSRQTSQQLKTPIAVSSSNLTTMRNGHNNSFQIQKQSPSTVKVAGGYHHNQQQKQSHQHQQQTQYHDIRGTRTKQESRNTHIPIPNYYQNDHSSGGVGGGILHHNISTNQRLESNITNNSDFNNKNFSCIILRSNEKSALNSGPQSSQKKKKKKLMKEQIESSTGGGQKKPSNINQFIIPTIPQAQSSPMRRKDLVTQTCNNGCIDEQQCDKSELLEQRLEQIEADAQALKRSILENNNFNVLGEQTKEQCTCRRSSQQIQEQYDPQILQLQFEISTSKKQAQQTMQKYHQVLTQYGLLQEQSQMKEAQIRSVLKDFDQIKQINDEKEEMLKQLRYENEKLLAEVNDLKIQLLTSSAYNSNHNNTANTVGQVQQLQQRSSKERISSMSFSETQHILELEQENFRKKVKRLTGELDSLETYFQSLQQLFLGKDQSLQSSKSSNSNKRAGEKGSIKQLLPLSVMGTCNKLFRNLQDSIDYIKDLFQNSKLKVTEGKRVQRKIRYEKLKNDFQTLMIQLAASQNIQDKQQLDGNQTQSTSRGGGGGDREIDFDKQQAQYKELEQKYEQQQQNLEKEKVEHQKKIELYKEQVQRMRENIDLFKDNIKYLKEQNEELQNKLANSMGGGGAINTERSNQSGPSHVPHPEIESLFNGLKEDNEKLANELKRVSDENFELQQYLGVSKETIQQQNGIIKGLQNVIDAFQAATKTLNSEQQQQQKQQQRVLQQINIPQINTMRDGSSSHGTQQLICSGNKVVVGDGRGFCTTAKYSKNNNRGIGGGIGERMGMILATDENNQLFYNERSKSCSSSAENQSKTRQVIKNKPILLHQSLQDASEKGVIKKQTQRGGAQYSNRSQKSVKGQQQQNHQQYQQPQILNLSQINLNNSCLFDQDQNDYQQQQQHYNKQQQANDLSYSYFQDSFIKYLSNGANEGGETIVQDFRQYQRYPPPNSQEQQQLLPIQQQQLNICPYSDELTQNNNEISLSQSMIVDQSNANNNTPNYYKKQQQQQLLHQSNSIPENLTYFNQENNLQTQGIMHLHPASSPMTARFSSFAQPICGGRKSNATTLEYQNEQSRDNIKKNTENILGEIQDIDDEIAQLQGTLIQALAQSKKGSGNGGGPIAIPTSNTNSFLQNPPYATNQSTVNNTNNLNQNSYNYVISSSSNFTSQTSSTQQFNNNLNHNNNNNNGTQLNTLQKQVLNQPYTQSPIILMTTNGGGFFNGNLQIESDRQQRQQELSEGLEIAEGCGNNYQQKILQLPQSNKNNQQWVQRTIDFNISDSQQQMFYEDGVERDQNLNQQLISESEIDAAVIVGGSTEDKTILQHHQNYNMNEYHQI